MQHVVVQPKPSHAAWSAASTALKAAFGDRFQTGAALREQHGHTTTYLCNQPPDGVVFAETTSDVATVVRLCGEHKVPIVPFGVGSSLEGQVNAPFGGVSLDLSRMNAVVSVNAEDMDCVIQPGVTRKQLNTALRDQGLFFPIDPGADATLGGMASTRASGTNAVRYGTMKDAVLSLEAVMADGTVIRTGMRARKSSAGYDLTRLLIGAEGHAGHHHRIDLAPARHPRDDRQRGGQLLNGCGRLRGGDRHDALRHSGGTYRASGYADGESRQRLFRPDVSRGGRFFWWNSTARRRASPTKRRFSAPLSAISAARPCRRRTRPKSGTVSGKRGTMPIGRHCNCGRGRRAFPPMCACRSPSLPNVWWPHRSAPRRTASSPRSSAYVGDGNFHVILLMDMNDADEVARGKDYVAWLNQLAIDAGGTCTGEHGIGQGKQRFLRDELGDACDVMAAIKQALDPAGLLNPGKILS